MTVRILGLLASVVVLLGLCASPATAKKKKKGLGPVVTVSAVSPQATTTGAVVTATATCPKGKKAFGGGFATTPSNQALIFPHESHRSGARSWIASGSYFGIGGTPPPLGITSIVHCRRLAKTPKEIVISVPVVAQSNSTPATAIARCQGKKQRLISGGYLYSPPSNGNVNLALVYENQPVGKDWHASVQNSGQGSARTLTGYAYCAKGLKKAPKITSGTSAQTLPAALAQISATSAPCPAKSQLTAGGFVSPFPATTPMTARPLYYESLAAGASWRASALSGFGGGPLSITALGICT